MDTQSSTSDNLLVLVFKVKTRSERNEWKTLLIKWTRVIVNEQITRCINSDMNIRSGSHRECEISYMNWQDCTGELEPASQQFTCLLKLHKYKPLLYSYAPHHNLFQHLQCSVVRLSRILDWDLVTILDVCGSSSDWSSGDDLVSLLLLRPPFLCLCCDLLTRPRWLARSLHFLAFSSFVSISEVMCKS